MSIPRPRMRWPSAKWHRRSPANIWASRNSDIPGRTEKSDGDLRERVAEACRVLARLDLTKAATGRVSARVPGTDRALVRARGPAELGVRYTTAREVIEVDLDGKVIG